jgi:FkbM family methyltransferase
MISFFHYFKKKAKSFFNDSAKDKIDTFICKYLSRGESISIIDIGAHRGDFVDQLEKHYDIAKAVLIEPIAELFGFLQTKFKRKNFTIFQNALSDRDRESIEFQINEFAETSSMLVFKSEMEELSNVNVRLAKKENVTSRTLDSIMEETQFPAIDLIKIDVQGVEHLVLKGGRKTLARTKYIWIELSFKPLYIGSSVFQDVYGLMEENGFILLEISPGHRSSANELLQADALFANRKLV